MNKLEFTVIDKKTGSYPNVGEIALKEDWAKHLCYCDIDCFAICEDGTLLLTDDCGRSAGCPPDRFEVIFENSRDNATAVFYWGDGYDNEGNLVYDSAHCPNCKRLFEYDDCDWESAYCPNCGQKLDWGVE